MEEFIQVGRIWQFNDVPFLEKEHNANYIEAEYHVPNLESIRNSPYLVISAAGAVGKSAFAQHLVSTKHAMLWNLSKLRLGSNTFVGSLVQAVGPTKLGDILESLRTGQTTLVFDAIDEAELHSGWSGITDFLKDVVQYTTDARNCSVIFLSRRDTAELIEITLADFLSNQAPPSSARIGYFSKTAAVKFLLAEVEKYKGKEFSDRHKKVLTEKANEALSMSLDGSNIGTTGSNWDNDDQQKFFGYAPVLQTISKLLAEPDNPYTLSIGKDASSKAAIISDIFDLILQREQGKFVNAATERPEFSNTDILALDLYSPHDQLNRLIGHLLDDKIVANSAPSGFAQDQREAFEEMVKSFLPQHPFLDGKNFAGPAFRDYLIAVGLLSDELRLSTEILVESAPPLFSPIFAGIYAKVGKKEGYAKDIEIIYESANSSTGSRNLNLSLFVNEDRPNYLTVEISSDEKADDEDIELSVPKTDSLIFHRRLINANIFFDGKIVLGRRDMEFEISNSELFANCIQIDANLLRIRPTGNSVSRIETDSLEASPSLRIDSKPEYLAVAWSGSNAYPWTAFTSTAVSSDDPNDVASMLHVIARILGWFRKDRRDEYGRYKDLIRKHVVGKSKTARFALGYLQSINALYERGNLYFIDSEKLDEHEVSWTMIKSGKASSKAIKSIENYLSEVPEPPSF